MASGATGPDPLDALAQFSVLSLFPRSFGALQNASDPYDLERELDSLHSHLGTIALQGPKKLFNQAKSIMESCSELLNTDIPGEVAAEERDEFDAAKANEENPKRRRPGLGLKRPKFSLKPDSSQPAVNLEATFDIDSYEDPDEFFAAFERMEQANREIMRQNGIVPEDPGQHKLKEARRRRPGLPGRSYKHKFSESGIFPPETVMESYVAVSNSTIQQDAENESNDESRERDFTGSTKAKRKHSELLDELLSLNLEDLDGDGAASLLQEHLQIKAINIENLELPDLQDIQKDDWNASVGNLSKQIPVLLDIQNLMKRAHGHSPTKHKAARNCLDMEHAEKESDDVNKRNKSDGSSHNPGESISGTLDRGDFDVVIGSNSNDLQNEVTNHKTDLPMMAEFLDRPSTDLDSQAEKEAATSTQLNAETEDSDTEEANEDGDILDPLVFSIVEEFARDGSSKRPDGVLEQQIEVPHVCSQAEKEAATPTQQNAEAGDSNTEEANEDGDILVSSEVEEFARDGSSKCPGGVLEQQIEEPVATLPSGQGEKKSCPSCNGRKRKEASALRSSRESENPVATECQQNERRDDASEELIEEAAQEMHTGGRKSRPRPKKPRLVNELSRRRTSLGGAGTTWDNGVRRSTRIRSRPLAFWKGERFLYGRIHESLATVIGVKYESPGDGKPRLKVKSFVSDEYKELVELVS
ncbi:centromere protein C isoform X4 [Punica granatum]|uniref:Centromere protein C isoform X4 n=1 Tax=Punica granatum TaxID=22663 RepID=A0A6P8D8Z0_PUNGR|nr:centromere protein C isoform X4 [Punica granatum]